MTKEQERLHEANTTNTAWRNWGPYLTERQWGTVREDYSANGDAWHYTTHDMARSKTYRWGEEGLGGVCDLEQILCFAPAFWNKKDPILKERLFGLSGPEGNHGEDVKEYYYYLDNLPTHAYMKMLYKYPQAAFPYQQLVEENRKRNRNEPEFELIDTGIFNEDRYFDIFIEYAKQTPQDMLVRITVHNRGPESADLHIIPQLWYSNTWAWGYNDYKPLLMATDQHRLKIDHIKLGGYYLYWEGNPQLLFTDNESNSEKLYGTKRPEQKYYKDGINDYIVSGNQRAASGEYQGTKAALNYNLTIPAKESVILKFRLTTEENLPDYFADFDNIFTQRIQDADEFYENMELAVHAEEEKNIMRQAFAGMLWGKQFYHYNVPKWLSGDPAKPSPPASRLNSRNSSWIHLINKDIISMPDTWEYPWYAAWDLAFHCVTLARIDPEFAKQQLLLLTREWYMNPNGELPAYEWEFSNVNPPVQAWASWQVYKTDQEQHGNCDTSFLKAMFNKLLINFTWWVNRQDNNGNNIFQGGFLGLDNISVFDRSAGMDNGEFVDQADSTSWMAMYALNMMRIALELAKTDPVYQDLATKFFEHFLYIAGSLTNIGNKGINIWDEDDEFFYDVLNRPDNTFVKLKVRSIVGLIPLFAVEVIDSENISQFPAFKERMHWFLKYRPDLANLVSRWEVKGKSETILLSLLRGHRMKMLLKRMLDESEFLSEYGVRALSRYHLEHPYTFHADGITNTIGYEPGESKTNLFGGNSNWRGPIWFPINYLIIKSLRRFHHYYGNDFLVEYPTHSGNYLTLDQIADELSKRISKIFLPDQNGQRPLHGNVEKFQNNAHFKDHLLFYEYFHGDNGSGLGASHQTGWTGLIANLLLSKKW